MAGLAQQFGFSIPRSGNAERSPEFYQDLIQSREILDKVVRLGVEVGTAAGVTNVDLAEHFEIEGETPEERNALTRRRLAEGVVSVAVGRETGIVIVSARTDDPGLSAAIVRRLLDLISAFDSETRPVSGLGGERLCGEPSRATASGVFNCRGFAQGVLGREPAVRELPAAHLRA